MYVSLRSLLHDLQPHIIAQRVENPHNQARVTYPLNANTVGDFREFEQVLASYCQHHHSQCVALGGMLPRTAALGIAKRIVEREYQRRGGDIVMAYNDAHLGTSGGLRAILDKVCDALRNEAVEQYVRDAFDRHVLPNSFDEKVELMRQFIAECAVPLGLGIRAKQPEAYARDYEPLIRGITEALAQSAAQFRRFQEVSAMDDGLKRTLDRLRPERTIDLIAGRVDDAINSFPVRTVATKSWAEFTDCIERFFLHLHDYGLQLPTGFDHGAAGEHWCRCDHFLKQVYGPNGAAAAFRRSQTGIDGGLVSVVRDLAQHMVRHWADNEIAGIVAEYVRGLAPEECFSAARAYLNEYGRFLPFELQTGSMPTLVIKFAEMLRAHPYLLQQVRRVGSLNRNPVTHRRVLSEDGHESRCD